MQSLNELKIGESSADNNIESEPVEETVNFFARLIAYLVDISIVYIPFFLLSSELDNYLAKAEIEIAYLRYYKMLVSELVWMVYTIYFYRKYCATPGKLFFQIQVIAEETKSRLSISRIILREIIARTFSGFFFLGYLIALTARKGKTLHDMISRTIVVLKKPRGSEDKGPPLSLLLTASSLSLLYLIFLEVYWDDSFQWVQDRYFPEFTSIERQSKEDALKTLEKDPEKLSRVSRELLSDQSFLKQVINHNYKAIQSLPVEYNVSLDNQKLFLEISKGDVKYASPSMVSDNNFQKLAKEEMMLQEKKMVELSNLRAKRERIKELLDLYSSPASFERMLRNDPDKLAELPEDFFSDERLKNIVRVNPLALKYLPSEIEYSESFVRYFILFIKEPETYANDLIKENPFYKKSLEALKKERIKNVSVFKKNINSFYKKVASSKSDLDKSTLKEIPREMYNDESFVLGLLKANPYSLFLIPNDSNYSVENAIKILKENEISGLSARLPPKLAENIEVSKMLAAKSIYNYNSLPPRFRENKEVILVAVSKFPALIEQISALSLEDRDIANAIILNWNPLHPYLTVSSLKPTRPLVQYFDEEFFEENLDLLLNIIKVDPPSIGYIPPIYKRNKKVRAMIEKSQGKTRALVVAILNDPSSRILDVKMFEKFKDDYDIAFLTATHPILYYNIKTFNKRFLRDKTFAYKAIRNQSKVYKYFDESLFSDKEIMYELVQKHYYLLKKAKGDLRNSKELSFLSLKTFFELYKQNPRAKSYDADIISPDLYDDRELMSFAITVSPNFISVVGDELKNSEPFKSRRDELLKLAKDRFIHVLSVRLKSDLVRRSIPKFPEYFRNDKENTIRVLEYAPFYYGILDEKFRKDKEIVDAMFAGWENNKDILPLLERYSHPGNNKYNKLSFHPLDKLEKKYREQRSYVLRALKVSAQSYGYIDSHLKLDPEIKSYEKEYERFLRRYSKPLRVPHF